MVVHRVHQCPLVAGWVVPVQDNRKFSYCRWSMIVTNNGFNGVTKMTHCVRVVPKCRYARQNTITALKLQDTVKTTKKSSFGSICQLEFPNFSRTPSSYFRVSQFNTRYSSFYKDSYFLSVKQKYIRENVVSARYAHLLRSGVFSKPRYGVRQRLACFYQCHLRGVYQI